MTKKDYLDILKKSYFNLSEKDEKIFENIMRDDGLAKCKITFNLWAFLFGWFYLLYRRLGIEAFGVLIFSLLGGYILAYANIHPVLVIIFMIGVNSFLSGFCYHFLYLNKLSRDISYCGEYNVDIKCMKKRAEPKKSYVILALIVIIIFLWPWIYALITGETLHK